jgi:hypothetical protein
MAQMDEDDILKEFNKRHKGNIESTPEILALIRYASHIKYNQGYNDTVHYKSGIYPRFSTNESVQLISLHGNFIIGTVIDVKKIIDPNIKDNIWGYKLRYKGNSSELIHERIPEYHLSKIPQELNVD